MAITFDNASTAGGTTVNSVQWTHTVIGTDVVGVFGATLFNQTSLSSVAVNGAAMTKALRVVSTESGEVWKKIIPASGALTVSAICVGVATDTIGCGMVTYAGASTASLPAGQGSGTANATVINLSISSVASGVVVGFAGDGSNSTYTDPATQTRRFSKNQAAGNAVIVCSDKPSVAGTTSMSWSLAAAARTWFIGLCISATAAAAGGGTVIYTLSLTGCGI